MNRINVIVEILLSTQLVIDIGCDHGFLGIKLLQKLKTKFVWNVDINHKPLTNAKNNFIKKNLINFGNFFCSDGFEKLPLNYHANATVVCSGIGTKTILKILQKLPDYVNQIICLTHTLAYELRLWCASNQWYVYHEAYVHKNNKIYELVYFVKNIKLSSITYKNDVDFYFGLAKFYQNKNNYFYFLKYWKQQLIKLQKISVLNQKTFQKNLLNLIQNYLCIN